MLPQQCVQMHPSLCVPIRSCDIHPCRLYCSYRLWQQKVQVHQGTAGRKRLCIITENRCNKKKIDSKVGNMIGTKPCKSAMREPGQVIPEPVLPLSPDNDNDEIQAALQAFSTFKPTDRGISSHHHDGNDRAAKPSCNLFLQGIVSGSQPISALCDTPGQIPQAWRPARQPAEGLASKPAAKTQVCTLKPIFLEFGSNYHVSPLHLQDSSSFPLTSPEYCILRGRRTASQPRPAEDLASKQATKKASMHHMTLFFSSLVQMTLFPPNLSCSAGYRTFCRAKGFTTDFGTLMSQGLTAFNSRIHAGFLPDPGLHATRERFGVFFTI
jgi:hypothetical protein